MIRSLTSLKSKFRAAVFSGLAALSLMTGYAQTANQNTRLVFNNRPVNDDIDPAEMEAWAPRQTLYLNNDSNRTNYNAWLAQLDSLKDAPLLRKLDAVNDLVNGKVAYLPDSANNHLPDYFAPGAETVLTGKGDCEDFAIAKFFALQHLGVPESRMALLFVAHDGVSRHPDHCVLVADTSAANDWTNCLILNNALRTTHSLKTLAERGFKPFFTLNTKEARSCKLKPLKPEAP